MKPTEFLNEWSSRDRALALAIEEFDASICRGCGQPLHESTSEDGPDYSVNDRKCRGCALLSDAGSEHDEAGTQHFLDVIRR